LANVLPLELALDALTAGRPLPPRAVSITFDDGYRDSLGVALPALRYHGMPATFFLVPEFLDGTRIPWWETLAWAIRHATRRRVWIHDREVDIGDGTAAIRSTAASLKRLDIDARDAAVRDLVAQLEPTGAAPSSDLLLDWDGARALAAAGFTVGSHSLDHAILAQEHPTRQQVSLAAARCRLQAEVDQDVATIAYPNGEHMDVDGETVLAARAAGHRYGLLLEAGWARATDDPYRLPRSFVLPERGARGLYVQPTKRGVTRASARLRAKHPRHGTVGAGSAV